MNQSINAYSLGVYSSNRQVDSVVADEIILEIAHVPFGYLKFNPKTSEVIEEWIGFLDEKGKYFKEDLSARNRHYIQLIPTLTKSEIGQETRTSKPRHMRKIIIIILTTVLGTNTYGQSKEEKDIIKEATKLYKTEMASWYGTDIFLEKFSDKRQSTGGYFSYLADDKAVCVFFSKGDNPKIIGSFTFDSAYNVNTAVVDGQEHELTKHEIDLLTIRQTALATFKTDTLFKSFKDMNPNFIPLSDDQGKRVYILTGPQKQGIVVFGNDYLLTFDKENKLKDKKRLHKNIISIEYGKRDDKIVLATMHTHLPETGDLITATDVCTLMLYEKYAQWGQHYVISEKNVSIWDCKKDQLTVMTKKAWDKIYENQKKVKQ